MNEKKLKKVENVYSFWGRFSALYSAQDIITFMGRAQTIRKKAVERIGLKNGDKVLEVACGSGRNLKYLVTEVGKKGSILGFDYSKEMLNASKELSEKKRWDNVKLVQGDAAKLNIKSKNFDGIISVLGISAVPGWESALKKCKKLLKNGGRLVVCDARLFQGKLEFLNPLVKWLYKRFAAWDPSKDIPKKMKEIFGNVEIESLNLGTFFIAVSVNR